MSVTVRLAGPEEYRRAGEIALASYRRQGLLALPDGSEVSYAGSLLDAAGRADRAQLLVATTDGGSDEGADGGEVVGTVTWCPAGSSMRELASDDDQAEFRMLAVDPDRQGLGAGRALAEACLQRARHGGYREVLLSTQPAMQAAQALYASLGFVRAPELDWVPLPGIELWGLRLTLATSL